jgi:hypothetical protein
MSRGQFRITVAGSRPLIAFGTEGQDARRSSTNELWLNNPGAVTTGSSAPARTAPPDIVTETRMIWPLGVR